MRRSVSTALVVLAACGGGRRGASVAPVASSGQAMVEFMQAVRDSNLTRMSQLWGSTQGPSSETGNPPGFDKRLVIMQAYLRADSSKIVSDVSIVGDDAHRRLVVAIYRNGCLKQVPATMLRLKSGGWIVNSIDLASAGNPARPCEGGSGSGGGLTR